MPKLELLVDSYSPPNEKDRNVPSPELHRGDQFDASKEEAERLINAGAALDPKEAQKQREAELEEELTRLQERKAAVDAEIKAAKSSGS